MFRSQAAFAKAVHDYGAATQAVCWCCTKQVAASLTFLDFSPCKNQLIVRDKKGAENYRNTVRD
jgi:homospermidine synthase